jgi:hypothetical protein
MKKARILGGPSGTEVGEEGGMKEIPGHPLDLSRLAILPPQQWTVTPWDDNAVVIGAWVDPVTLAVHKRIFRFTCVGEGAESAGSPVRVGEKGPELIVPEPLSRDPRFR